MQFRLFDRPHDANEPSSSAFIGMRRLLLGTAAGVLGFVGHASAQGVFSLDTLTARAKAMAEAPYRAPPITPNTKLLALSYDDYRDIRYTPQASWWRDQGLPFELQFFHVGRGFNHPVDMHEIVDGKERPLVVPRSAFNYGRAAPAVAGETDAQIAGFRVHAALNNTSYKDEVIVFQGASYLRAVAANLHYGLSARGLAIDTVGGTGEEFPSFEAFWLERPAKDATSLTIYALLNSQRATGAYRFIVRPGATTEIDVQTRVFLRAPVATLGIAPLTSMFFGGENQPLDGDFRPEVHDSDGLMVHTGDGEWLWRPLVNPARLFTTSFSMKSLRGFGLMQRDRNFSSYEDPEARYDRRPSVWIEPEGDWGPGRVELMQFHTADETNDNVVAYWVPAKQPAAGEPLSLGYTMRWQGDAEQHPPGGWTQQSRVGRSFAEPAQGEVQFNVDFTGPALTALPDDADLKAVVTSSDNATVTFANVYRHPVTKGWRMSLKIQRRDPQKPVELRAYLKRGADVLTETWTYALPPQ